jgi:hypothetical protein
MKISSGSFLLLACIGIFSIGSSTVRGQGDRCPALGGKIDNTKFQHCAVVRQGLVQIFYDLSETDIKGCVEGKTNGWVGLGFGGNGSDYVIGWNPGGNGVVVGDYHGHTATVKDAQQDHTVWNDGDKTVTGEANGYSHFCFQRLLDTGDAKDTVLKTDIFMNFPWALRNGDPTNGDNLDNAQHGSDGTGSFKIGDPTEERPQNNNNGGNGDGAPGDVDGALVAVGAVAGVIVLAGVGYMVKQNNAQVEAYGGGMDAGGWGHGGYGSSGTSGGHRSQGSHRSRSKRSRSRSHSSKNSRGSHGSGKRSQASHRSRSKGQRH